jgi:DNA-binding response OmpR family regulator
VLIVDHERDLADTCARLLRRSGYDSLVAYSGRQGTSLIDQSRPRVVLTDFSLPDLDGLSLLRYAREQSPSIPGILMTAHVAAHAITGVPGERPFLYLPKPFSNAELLAAVERALRGSRESQ